MTVFLLRKHRSPAKVYQSTRTVTVIKLQEPILTWKACVVFGGRGPSENACRWTDRPARSPSFQARHSGSPAQLSPGSRPGRAGVARIVGSPLVKVAAQPMVWPRMCVALDNGCIWKEVRWFGVSFSRNWICSIGWFFFYSRSLVVMSGRLAFYRRNISSVLKYGCPMLFCKFPENLNNWLFFRNWVGAAGAKSIQTWPTQTSDISLLLTGISVIAYCWRRYVDALRRGAGLREHCLRIGGGRWRWFIVEEKRGSVGCSHLSPPSSRSCCCCCCCQRRCCCCCCFWGSRSPCRWCGRSGAGDSRLSS